MGKYLRGIGVLVAATFVSVSMGLAQTADPPGRVGRVAYINGAVSYHDREETNWAPAAINYPMTSGNALWTEPNGRAEIFVGATRIRMQGSTQLETLSLTDEEFRLRISQGRIDVKTVGLPQSQPVEVLTPRGSVMLVGDGDYMIEAGTTDDATRVGVRAGSARVIAANGTELVVRAGEIGVLSGTSPPVFETVRMATPPMPREWAPRDRQIVTTQSVQYVPPGVTGVEELDYYGTWSTVGDYGRVWAPYRVPVGWAPYRHGRWRWVDPWGWTWVDDQPWGFAPSHYGRWVSNGGRWYWVPPQRQTRPVYAPAVVGFVDVAAAGAALAIGAAIAPVGWFPLGPREVYVPPYTANRTYIRNLNITNVFNVGDVDRRIEYVERRRDPRFRDDPRRDDRRDDARRDGRPGDDRARPTFINQRYTTVVPQQVFLRGDRVDRAAIRVAPDQLARAQVAPVAAPPVAATATVTSTAEPGKAPASDAKPPQGVDLRRAPLADSPVLGRPSRQDRPTATAPGPQLSRTQPPTGQAAPGTPGPGERQLPNLRTRDGRETDRAAPTPAPAKPGEPPAATPPAKPGEPTMAAPPAKTDDPAKPNQAVPARPPQSDKPAGKPGETPKAAEPPKLPVAPPKAADPPKPAVAPPQAAEPPKPPVVPPQAVEPPKPPVVPPKAAEPPKLPVAPPKAADPPKPPVTPPQAAEPPKPPVVPPKAAEPPKPPVAPPKAADPPKPPVTPPTAAEPPKPPAAPPKAAEPPKPPVAPPKAAEPPRPAPPPVQQAKPPEPPRPAPQAAPPPQPPRQAAPPQQAKPAAPPPQPQVKPPGRDRDDKGGDDRRR